MLRKEVANLNPDELETLKLLIRELDDPAFRTMGEVNEGKGGPIRMLDALAEREYLRPMVDIRTFVRDPYYLGETCKDLYPKLLDDMEELFNGGYREAVITGAIGIGKCVLGDTEIYDIGSGSRRLVSEIGELSVASMDDNGSISARPATSFRSGRKRCVTLVLNGGQAVTLSNDHPVFTDRGWVKAEEIKGTDLVATPRILPDAGRVPEVSDAEVKLLAYLMADGGTSGTNVSFTNMDAGVISEVRELVSEVGQPRASGGPLMAPTKYQSSGRATSYGLRGLSSFVKKYGLRGKRSKEKRLPAQFYGLDRRQIGLFLSRFWACDGSVYNGKRRVVEVCLASQGLIDDIRHLLLRLGIPSRKAYKRSLCVYKGERKWFDAWRLYISDSKVIVSFLDALGLIPGKERQCEELMAACGGIVSNTNVDVVPIGNSEISQIYEEIGKPDGLLRGFGGRPLNQRLSRTAFGELCDKYDYQGKYRWLADSDLLWERVRSVDDAGVHDVFDLSVPETHSFVGNGIVLHNTYFSSIVICRILYEISCLRDPHRSFSIAKDTNIAILALSINEALAMKVVFENIATKIHQSPYFQEHFPHEPTNKELRFPHNILVTAKPSTEGAVLGMNVISAIIDEGNFLGQRSKSTQANGIDSEGKAQWIYNQLVRRMKSRFQNQGRLPGMMVVVSSKQTRDDFTAKRIRESMNDPEIYVMDYNLWTVKPDRYSKQRFHVLVGNETSPSRILPPSEVDLFRKKIESGELGGMLVVDVPEDFRKDFEGDIDESLRDLAGVETVSVSPFIAQRDKISSCVDAGRPHPFDVESWDQTKAGGFAWNKLAKQVKIREGAEMIDIWQPLYYPGLPRHIHIDPSLRQDATGFCVGTVIGNRTVHRRHMDTQEEYEETVPVIWIDMLLRIVPPTGGEIDHGQLRGLVYQLQKHGFHIGLVTMDQWNSVSSLQIFESQGIESERLSVDKPIDAYETLKSAIYESRVLMYNYEPVLKELRALQKDYVKNKVDHPRGAGASKDVADALAGVVYSLSTRYRGGPIAPMKGISQYSDPVGEEQREIVETEEFFPPFVLG